MEGAAIEGRPIEVWVGTAGLGFDAAKRGLPIDPSPGLAKCLSGLGFQGRLKFFRGIDGENRVQ